MDKAYAINVVSHSSGVGESVSAYSGLCDIGIDLSPVSTVEGHSGEFSPPSYSPLPFLPFYSH